MTSPDPGDLCDGCRQLLDRRQQEHVRTSGRVVHDDIWRKLAAPGMRFHWQFAINKPMSAEWKRRLILAGLFVLGVVLIALAQRFPSWLWLHEIFAEIAKEIGIALVIAAALGATVDTALKIELVRDAFFAAFQYAFPPPLQGEILRIMRYRLICQKHFLLVRLEEIDKDTVRITCEVNRRIKNVSSSPEKIRPRLHIDEWGFPEKSKILECWMEMSDGTKVIGTQKRPNDPIPTILFEGKEVSIEPDKDVILFSKWTEVRRANDLVYFHFSHPTVNPEIEIPPVIGFTIIRSFGSASTKIEKVFSGREALSGTYLPYHHMVVRWCRTV